MESLTFEKPSRRLTAAECDMTFRARICVHCGKPIVIGPKSLYQQGYGGRALEGEFTLPYSSGDSIKRFLENTGFTVRTLDSGKFMIHVCQGTKNPGEPPREPPRAKAPSMVSKESVQATWTHRASEDSVEAEQRAFALAQLGVNR